MPDPMEGGKLPAPLVSGSQVHLGASTSRILSSERVALAAAHMQLNRSKSVALSRRKQSRAPYFIDVGYSQDHLGTMGETNRENDLLKLPSRFRRQIFSACGFPTDAVIRITTNTKYGILCVLTGTLHAMSKALLQLCRLTYEELSRMLYGENLLLVESDWDDEGDFAILNQFTSTSVRNMRYLSIRMNMQEKLGVCQYRVTRVSGLTSHDLAPNPDGHFLESWRRLCRRLSSFSQPSTLSLFVAMDCCDLAFAKEMVAPLQTLPILTDFALRLATFHNPEIQTLARDVVEELTCRS